MAKKKDESRPKETDETEENSVEETEAEAEDEVHEDVDDQDDDADVEADDEDEAEASSEDDGDDDDAEDPDDESDDDDAEDDAVEAKADDDDKKKKSSKKAAAKSSTADKKKSGSKKSTKAKPSDDKKKKAEPVVAAAPADPDAAVSDDIRELFGLTSDDKLEDVDDYEPDVRSGASVGAVIGLLIAVAAVVGLVIGAVQILKKRQDEIEEAYKQRKAAAEAEIEPEVRYGNLAMLASEPPRALVMQNDKPIYVRTPDGAYTEMRVAPDTRIQNIKIEEGGVVKYSLAAEGFKPYDIELNEYSWSPIPGSGDWEKVYTKIRMEPIEERLLPNCDEIQALGQGYQNACLTSKSDEVMTRKDYERIYLNAADESNITLTGTLTIESEPAGAKIFFNSRPLLNPETGEQAVTPYTFSEYKLGAPEGGAPDAPAPGGDTAPTDGAPTDGAPTDGAPTDGAPADGAPTDGAPADGATADGAPAAAPVDPNAVTALSITGNTSDSRLSVRLEKDGLAPYKTAIQPHHWTCKPIVDLEKVKAIQVPVKSEATAPDMLHHLCQYELTVKGKLFEPPKEKPEGAEGAEGAPAEGAPADGGTQ